MSALKTKSSLKTVRGGLAGLLKRSSILQEAKSLGVTPKVAARFRRNEEKERKDAERNIAEKRRKARKASEKATRKALAARKAREQRLKRYAGLGDLCLCCGERVGAKEQASIAFKLLNGPQGTIKGALCASHKRGDAWRGVGSIVAVLRAGDEPNPFPKLTREEAAQNLSKSLEELHAKRKAERAAQAAETYTVKSYAAERGVSLTTARRILNAAVKAGNATVDKTGKPYRYTVAVA